MRSVYECGCWTDQPISSVQRCAVHNKLVTSIYNRTPEFKYHRQKRLRLLCGNVLTNLRSITSSSIELICTTPDSAEYWARLNTPSFFTLPDTLMAEWVRVLQPGGHVILFVEQPVVLAALYLLHLHNFIVAPISLVHTNTAGFDSTKFCIVASLTEPEFTLGNFYFGTTSKLIRRIGVKGVVLDTSCIDPNIVLTSVGVANTIGLCDDINTYNYLLTKLGGENGQV